ncbi:protein CCSMST1 isoform X2 [Cheilinus undulatus]|uniref:protein CCSMST1 isoform X2 n=1 Tax=Cheilinus undulatus TaxID=241271 RepID=UPI001BD2C03C|nr:protein CCSMST1 isoform X2 [Cheilinus undulatus]
MSTTTGRVLSGLIRAAVSNRGIFTPISSIVRPSSVRTLSLSLQKAARLSDEENQVKDEPIKFSTSKASHRTWKVEQSMGSKFQRPWWKVLPVSLVATAFLLWCVFRDESEIDATLKKSLYEQLPDLLSEEEEEEKDSG